jgi:hypothetical protein
MTNRSAHAAIKGYFYQFDHTIVRLLSATTMQSSVAVEGIEDIDLEDGDESVFVQCKYYEGSKYNHSAIKDAVIQMLRHFHAAGCPIERQFRYQIYGHYKEGQEKLPKKVDLDFLKDNFLTYKQEQVTHAVHSELNVNDEQLTSFLNLLEIDVNAPSYEDQQERVAELLTRNIPGCHSEDAEVFYYPNAINVIKHLAIQPDEKDRRITKTKFVSEVNRKDHVFSSWLRRKFGDDYYGKLIKRKHFKFGSTKVPKASRIFVIDMNNEFDLTRATGLLGKIGSALSHVEHKRTPPEDRFCPYVLLRGLTAEELVSLKGNLLKQGIKFTDGYPFNGSSFYPPLLALAPNRENLISLKFIPTEQDLRSVVEAIRDSVVEVFDFFKTSPLDAPHIPNGSPYHAIKIDTPYFVTEVL